MDKVLYYEGIRVDVTHLYDMQTQAEQATLELGAQLVRSGAPSLPAGRGGALSGFGMSYDIGTQIALLAGSTAGVRSLAVGVDGLVFELLGSSAPLDLAAFAGGSLPFVVWGILAKVAADSRNMVIVAAAGDPETVVARLAHQNDDITLLALAPGAAPPTTDWFPVGQAASWNLGSPVWTLCGPLRDLTAHPAATDTSKPATLADALATAAVAYASEHVRPGDADAGKHGNVNVSSILLRDFLGGALQWLEANLAGQLMWSRGGAVAMLLEPAGLQVDGELRYISRKTLTEDRPAEGWRPKQGADMWEFDGDQWTPSGVASLQLNIPLRVPPDCRLLSVALRGSITATGGLGGCDMYVGVYKYLGGVPTAVPCNEADPVAVVAGATDAGPWTRTVTAPTVPAAGEAWKLIVTLTGDFTAASCHLKSVVQTIDVLYVRT